MTAIQMVSRWRALWVARFLAGAQLCLLWSSPVCAQESAAPSPLAPPPASASGAERPNAPKVVKPRLLYFKPPQYPEGTGEGRSATVVLKLLIQVDGSVGEISVLQSAGSGFDEAALSAAPHLIFTPAQVDGVATPVYVKHEYRFEPGQQEVVLLEEEAPREPLPADSGNLEGRLLVVGMDAPLAGARVRVTDRAAESHEVTSGADGSWQLEGLVPGQYQVSIQAQGFVTVTSTEEVTLGEVTGVTYRLVPETEGVEVIVFGERPPREVTKRTLERREIARIPGTGGDALRSIQSLPGVARPPGLAGLLIVRGSAPQSTNYFVDGALVPLVYHFGGLSSVVPTELLDRIDFYPGNFSNRYGRVMGGVVDVALASPNTKCTVDYGRESDEEGCFHGLAQVDLIDGRMLLQGPIGKSWKFAIGARRSWVDVWLKPVLEQSGAGVTTAPVYFDYQAIAETEPTAKSKLKLQLYGSDDALEVLINNPSAQEPAFGGTLSFGTAFYRLQATYENQLTRDWNLFTMLAVGRDVAGFSLGPALFRLDSYPIEFRSELGWNITDWFKINGGLDMVAVPVKVRVRLPEPPRPGESQPGPFSTRRLLESRDKTTAYRPAWYAEGELQPTRRLSLVPGVRLDFARDSGHTDLSPRISGRYILRGIDSDADDLGNKPLRTTLKAGVGYFYQPPNFQETDKVFGTPNLKSNRSIHYTVGIEQQLSKQVELGVEGYWKELDQLVSRSQAVGGFIYNNQGSGRVYGLETLLKYKPDKRFFGWLAYTLSRSVRRNSPEEPEYRFQFDQTHILTALGSFSLGGGWELGARYRIVSGNMQTPVNGAIYAADAGAYTPLDGKPFSERLPLFHQLDMRIEKTWQYRLWKLMAYLDVWNAYNNPAVEGYGYNFNFTDRAPQTGLPIIPSFGLRGEF